MPCEFYKDDKGYFVISIRLFVCSLVKIISFFWAKQIEMNLHLKIIFINVWKHIGFIGGKEEEKAGLSEGLQGFFHGFAEGKAQDKSQGAALQAQAKPYPTPIIISYLYLYMK